MKKEKTILITGCSSGIGLDAALTLKNRGWDVFATCRKVEDCMMLRKQGLKSFVLDLSNTKSIREALELVKHEANGKLDAVFNNGAFAIPGAIEDLPLAALREIFEVNFFGQVDVIKQCIPIMRSNNGGKIINCSSVLGFTGLPFRGAYVATKFALEGITDVLRRENIDPRIQFILIEPGPIKTKIRQNSQKHYEKWIKKKTSPFYNIYVSDLERRLYDDKSSDFFELEPSAVTKKLIKILETKNPRPRYYVTTPTYVASMINRIFSTKLQDLLLKYRKQSD